MTGFDDTELKKNLREVAVVETTDEDGNIHYFEPVEEFEIDGSLYALLVYQGNSLEAPESEEGYEEEFVVMKVTIEDSDRVYESTENEDEFNKVIEALEGMDFEVDLHDHLGLCDDHVHGVDCHHDHKHHDN
jgi:hypothetical protein